MGELKIMTPNLLYATGFVNPRCRYALQDGAYWFSLSVYRVAYLLNNDTDCLFNGMNVLLCYARTSLNRPNFLHTVIIHLFHPQGLLKSLIHILYDKGLEVHTKLVMDFHLPMTDTRDGMYCSTSLILLACHDLHGGWFNDVYNPARLFRQLSKRGCFEAIKLLPKRRGESY